MVFLSSGVVLAMLLFVVVGHAHSSNKLQLLPDAQLAAAWGGASANPCNNCQYCKSATKSCTALDCEQDTDGKYCSGSSSGQSVHGCWKSSTKSNGCFQYNCSLSTCYGECWWSLGACDSSPSGTSYQRISCSTVSSEPSGWTEPAPW